MRGTTNPHPHPHPHPHPNPKVGHPDEGHQIPALVDFFLRSAPFLRTSAIFCTAIPYLLGAPLAFLRFLRSPRWPYTTRTLESTLPSARRPPPESRTNEATQTKLSEVEANQRQRALEAGVDVLRGGDEQGAALRGPSRLELVPAVVEHRVHVEPDDLQQCKKKGY